MTDSWPEGNWFIEFGSPDDLAAFRLSNVLAQGRTRFQHYQIIASPILGKALILDGVLQSAARDEVIYHEALVQPVMLTHPLPRQVAVLGGGEGATIREVLRHSGVQEVCMIDLDKELVNLCREFLPEFAAGAWDDPRLRLFYEDGRAWLAGRPDASLDVVILDITDPLEGGPAFFLFTREMFILAQAKLRPGGLLSIQAGSAGQAVRLLPHLYRTLRVVFPQVIPYTAFLPSFNDLYGFVLAGGPELHWPTPERLSRILQDRNIASLKWLLPEFAPALPLLPGYLNTLLTQQGRILTDSNPIHQVESFPINLSPF